jgi:oxygen-dependent protoporphyrinogen oxidase
MPETKSIAIVGAGATGLAAAHRLAQLGHRVRVFERSGRIGGAVRTERTEEGWLVESGPNSLLSGKPGLAQLLDELGIAGERVDATPTARKRFIVRGGRLVPAPLSSSAFFASGLFSPLAKARLLLEFLTRPRVRTADVSLASFVRSHFGREFVDYALNPFVAGVYAGDPEKLSARHAFPPLWELERRHGSLLRGQVALARARRARGESAPVVFSFRRGLQTLIDALAAHLPADALTRGAQIDALVPGSPWNVVWHDANATHTESFDAVVLAVPAPALAELRFGSLGERPLVALGAMEQPPVASLFVGLRRAPVAHPHHGLGVLVPPRESRPFIGSKF